MRTFAIGDIHGDDEALARLLERLPAFEPDDTLVFLGDYIDRGPRSREVVARIRGLQAEPPCKVVALRGNHEDTWARSFGTPNPAFLLHRGNGCIATWRSFTGRAPSHLDDSGLSDDEFIELLDVPRWFPPDVAHWMRELPAWYEDAHAIYVHAGLDGEGDAWAHPSAGREKALLWMREPDFYTGYHGKRVVFGHTRTRDLPIDHLGFFRRLVDDPADVWLRGDLVGVDTGSGMGGFLSAIELPRMKVYESR